VLPVAATVSGLIAETAPLPNTQTHQLGARRERHRQGPANATAPHDLVISVHVGASVDEAYAEAKRRGYEIVHPLTEEAWGVRRFFVRAPDGNVIYMVSHSDE
jgi:uncharacterized glyoxalase superfamily protein PhnB